MRSPDVARQKERWRKAYLATRSSRRTAAKYEAPRPSDPVAQIEALVEAFGLEGEAVLAGYVPLPSEVDILRLLATWSATRGPVYVPTADAMRDAGRGEARWRRLTYPSRRIKSEELDAAVALVPGLVFGMDGARLGRGAGWYDRALAAMGESTVAVGVCFPEDVVEGGLIPADGLDRSVDGILTPAGLTVL